MVLRARVAHALHCTLSGGAKGSLASRHGRLLARRRFGPDRSGRPERIRVVLTVRGAKGATATRSVTVTEAGARAPVTTSSTTTAPTTTTVPPSTTTTLASGSGQGPYTSNQCNLPCTFQFSQPAPTGLDAVGVTALATDVFCPDLARCLTVPHEQLDDISVTECAGPTGVADAGTTAQGFGLSLLYQDDGWQLDPVTYDKTVANALGNYGAIAPGQCITGDVYIDASSDPLYGVDFTASLGSVYAFVYPTVPAPPGAIIPIG